MVSVVPYLLVLASACESDRAVRRWLRAQLLPPRWDFTQRPECGDASALSTQCIRIMAGALGPTAAVAAGDLLFAVCAGNVARLVRRVGYGNAAGTLARRGLLGSSAAVRGAAADGSGTGSSNSGNDNTDNCGASDDDADDAAEQARFVAAGADPVTGAVAQTLPIQPAPADGPAAPSAGEQLAELLDRLERAGLVRVLPDAPDAAHRSHTDASDDTR